MKKIQPPRQARQTIANSPRTKTNPKTPPPSYQYSSTFSHFPNSGNSPYLQKLPSKGKNGNISKRILTPSESNCQGKSIDLFSPVQPKIDYPLTEIRPITPYSPVTSSNQNLNGNKSPAVKILKAKSSYQISQPLKQPTQFSNQKPASQRRTKVQQPSIQRPIPSQRSNNGKSPRCFSPKFDPSSNFPSINSHEFHYFLEKKLEICSRPLILTKYFENLEPNPNPNLPINDKATKPNTQNKNGITIEDVQLKTLILTQILKLVTEHSNHIKDEEQDMIIDMIMSNILRPQRYVNPNLLFSEVPQILPDPEWQHLDLVYLILAQMQSNLPFLLTHAFCKALFPVMNSAETNERIEIINFFKEYVNIHVESRKELMSELTQVLNMHIELSDRPFAVWTILPIFKEICDLSEMPNYYEYDHEIKTSIIPLLRDKYAFFVFPLLNSILLYYTEKQTKNARYVLEYVLKYWPHTSTTKQSNYTVFLAEMLHKLSPDDLRHFLKPVFTLFANEIISTSPKLAESSLTIWLIPELEKRIEAESNDVQDAVLELIVPSIMKSANDHWWEGIRDIAMVIMSTILAKHNLEMLKDVSVVSEKKKNQMLKTKHDQWNEILEMAKNNDAVIEQSVENHLNRLFT